MKKNKLNLISDRLLYDALSKARSRLAVGGSLGDFAKWEDVSTVDLGDFLLILKEVMRRESLTTKSLYE